MKRNSERSVQLADLLDAIQDQSRIVLALQGNFAGPSDAARRLVDLGIPPVRVAALLNKPLNHITSAMAKARKKTAGPNGVGSVDVIQEAAE